MSSQILLTKFERGFAALVLSTILVTPGTVLPVAFGADLPAIYLDQESKKKGLEIVEISPGKLTGPDSPENSSSWRFDGRTTILASSPSNTAGFESNFTWEGFFLAPSTNQYLPETGIADRLISQFAFDKGNWTRLAIGLVADSEQRPRLSVELEGFEGRSFGLGNRPVTPDHWHHFALVHTGTPSAARIRWYLDYELCGEILLGGQSNQNTLRPPGSAPFTIGARLKQDDRVNRGFDGYLDEIRLTPRPLAVGEFLRTVHSPEKPVDTRALLSKRREAFWKDRHRWAEAAAAKWMSPIQDEPPPFTDRPIAPAGDSAFLRRLSLAVRGRIPTLDEAEAFLSDQQPDKRTRLIDRFLASPEWADHWVAYWQDVLAENPSVVFPTLNNSGPFRQWIHDSFLENKPFDRFVTELILMEETGKPGNEDSPAGFALATGNDVPMAMRAHVVMKAFAAVDLQCARCHDSPEDDFTQSDLFLVASYLNNGSLEVPSTSVAATKKTSAAVITTSLRADQKIKPLDLSANWLEEPARYHDGLHPITPGNHRAELAALITSPHHSRFSDVIVNRAWKRYFGKGLVEPVDNWNKSPQPSNTNVHRYLSSFFVRSGYDLKALARLILASPAWQAKRDSRQTMTAEQLVDSLFVAVGKEFEGETMGVHATDPGAAQLPRPQRSWQFAALPNERDRPALGMPVNQTIVDVMAIFGWNGNRQQPRSEREEIRSPLQPLILSNGLMSQRIVRLSDRSAITELCLTDQPLPRLIDQLFLAVLTRPPDTEEREAFVALLRDSYGTRRTGNPRVKLAPLVTFQPDWRKHLEPDQTRLVFEAQRRVARGEAPTQRLTREFRERIEDGLWALINTPEFFLIP